MQKRQRSASESGPFGDEVNGWRHPDRSDRLGDANSHAPQRVTDEWFWALIRGRRSVRRYRSDPIARPLLEGLLTAAVWAPSAHNRQPWRFCVVTAQAAKDDLSDRMGRRWRADLGADGVDAAVIERRVRISHTRISGAAALVAVSVSLEEMDDYPDRQRQEAEWMMAVQSTALACQNLLLAAQQFGLARLLDVRAAVRARPGAAFARPARKLASPGADYARLRGGRTGRQASGEKGQGAEASPG